MTFLFLFIASFLVIAFVLTLYDLDLLTALSASATALANVGPWTWGSRTSRDLQKPA